MSEARSFYKMKIISSFCLKWKIFNLARVFLSLRFEFRWQFELKLNRVVRKRRVCDVFVSLFFLFERKLLDKSCFRSTSNSFLCHRQHTSETYVSNCFFVDLNPLSDHFQTPCAHRAAAKLKINSIRVRLTRRRSDLLIPIWTSYYERTWNKLYLIRASFFFHGENTLPVSSPVELRV